MANHAVLSRSVTRNTAILVASSMLLTSCVSAPLSRDDRLGVDDGTDVCRPQVVALDSTGNYFALDMITGALAGAATGALVGGVAAAMSGGNVAKGVLIGAAAGGMAGGLGGYFKNRMDQGRDQAILAINNDMTKEYGELDKTDAAIKGLMSCRMRQRDKIRSDYAAKRINKSDAQGQWAMLQQQLRKDQEVIRNVSENIGKRQDEYKYATDQMITEFDINKLTPAERQQAKKRMAANNKKIDAEHQKELAKIRQESAQRKKEKALSDADLKREEQEKIAQAKQQADYLKSVNEKTGGNEQVVASATNLSASQAKKGSISSSAAAAASMANDDAGFEKSSGIKQIQPHEITLTGTCPMPAAGQGVTLSQYGWSDLLSGNLFNLRPLATAVAG